MFSSCQNNTISNRIIIFEKKWVSELPDDYVIYIKTQFYESLITCNDYYYISSENNKFCINYEQCKNHFSYIIYDSRCRNDEEIYDGKYYWKCPIVTCIYLSKNH